VLETTRRVLFHPEASVEYAEARAWYAERGSALAESFEREVERALRLIVEAPGRWARFGRRHRRILTRRFPYHVVYREVPAGIWVVAVAHGHRRPGYWAERDS